MVSKSNATVALSMLLDRAPLLRLLLEFPLFLYRKLREIFGFDKRTLALFRILLGLTVLWDLADRAWDLQAHYTDWGLMPRTLVIDAFWSAEWFSVYMVSGLPWVVSVVFCLNTVFAVMLTVGYYTRVSAFVCFLFCLSIQARNIIIGHSGDILVRLALFYAILLPLGDLFSIDSVLRLRAKKPRAVPKPRPRREPGSESPYLVSNILTVAWMLQVLAVYFTAYYHKSAKEWNDEGSATWLSLQLDMFRADPYGAFLLQFPRVCRFFTNAVHDWQLAGNTFFFWPVFTGPAKLFGVLGYFAMHVGLGMCLRLGTFSWITCSCCLVMLPPFFWDEVVFNRWVKREPQMTRFRVCYRASCGFCRTLACAVSQLLLCPETQLVAVDLAESSTATAVAAGGDERALRSGGGDPRLQKQQPAAEGESTVANGLRNWTGWLAVVDHTGALHLDWDAVVAICRASPLLRPVSSLAVRFEAHGKWLLGLLYIVLHEHEPQHRRPHEDDGDDDDEEKQRHQQSSAVVSGYLRRPPPSDRHGPAWQRSPALKQRHYKLLRQSFGFGVFMCIQVFSVFLVYAVLTLNGANIGWHPGPDYSYRHIIALLQMDQYWGVFAPRPPDVFFWINIEATLDSGQKAELFANRAYINAGPVVPHTWEKPKEVWYGFKNHRWIKFFENGYLSHPQFRELRGEFGKFVCRNWNTHNHGSERLWQYKVHLFSEQANYATMDGFNRINLGSQVLWDHICYNKR